MTEPRTFSEQMRALTVSRLSEMFLNLNSIALITLISLGIASTGLASDADPKTPIQPLKRTFETLKGEKYECEIWGLRESEIGLTLPNGASFWVSIKKVSKVDRDWIALRRPKIAEYVVKAEVASSLARMSSKPLNRTFETLQGRKLECEIWGLTESEIGLTLPSGKSVWVSVENVSQSDRDWINLRRPHIAEYVAKSPRVILAKFQGAESNVTTEALQSRLSEDWAGEQNRVDNKFIEIAKVTGINSADSATLKGWFEQLREGLKYDRASKDIVWSIPTSVNYVGGESVKEIYSQLILGTLLQKIGVSDVDQWRTHVKIEFVAPKAGEKEGSDKPEKDTNNKDVVKPAGELSPIQCCCNGPLIEFPVCGQTYSPAYSNSPSYSSYDPCSPSVDCEETVKRCKIFGRRR